MLQTVILAGGQGTRLREETESRPKPMVEIGGYPIIWHIMKTYAYYGHKDFYLCLGYKGNMIREYFLNYRNMTQDITVWPGISSAVAYKEDYGGDLSITLSDTGLNTMTGGRLARMEKYIKDDTFMVTYGDGLSDVNISELLKFHRSHGKIATVTSVLPASRFGCLDIQNDGSVRSFLEKPKMDTWINSGYFVFNKEIFEYLDGDECILEQEPLSQLASEGELMAYRHNRFFYAMDTYREYLELNKLWDGGNAPWAVWDQ